MRLANAGDEILPLRDPRVQQNPGYMSLLLLAQVITRLGTLEQVDVQKMELLVLPGGLGGVASIQMDLFATALIQKAYDQGCWLGAICAAPSILAGMGLLDRRRAACHPCVWEEMGSAAVDREAQVVVDGRIVTGQAAGAAYLFGLKLVEVLRGPEESRKVADAILFRG